MILQKYNPLLFILIFAFSCTMNNETDEPHNVDLSVESTIIRPDFIDTLIGNAGVIRGVDFNFSVEEVRGVEKALHNETSIDSNGVRMERYFQEFNISNSMDVEYYFTSEKNLKKIVLVVYCEDSLKQQNVFNGLNNRVHVKEGIRKEIRKVGGEISHDVEMTLNRLN